MQQRPDSNPHPARDATPRPGAPNLEPTSPPTHPTRLEFFDDIVDMERSEEVLSQACSW